MATEIFSLHINCCDSHCVGGGLAQMVERALRMREVVGSMPRILQNDFFHAESFWFPTFSSVSIDNRAVNIKRNGLPFLRTLWDI